MGTVERYDFDWLRKSNPELYKRLTEQSLKFIATPEKKDEVLEEMVKEVNIEACHQKRPSLPESSGEFLTGYLLYVREQTR